MKKTHTIWVFMMEKLLKMTLKTMSMWCQIKTQLTAGFSYKFDINDVVMINHRLFKLNDTIDTEIALPEFLEALSTIDYTNKHSFPLINNQNQVTMN